MSLSDRIRIERAVLTYDFWLDLRGAPWRRRRDLRAELRANLRESTARNGSRAAVAALGSTRVMAAEASPTDPSRPRWTAGLQAGSGRPGRHPADRLPRRPGLGRRRARRGARSSAVRGSVTLLPGPSMEYAPAAEGFSVSTSVGRLPLAVGVLVFVLVARPLRAVARSPVRS